MKARRISRFSSVTLALVLLLVTVAPAIAAPSALTALNTIYVQGKGLVVHFDSDVVFAPGSVTIGEETFGLACKAHDSGSVVCWSPVPLRLVGEAATLSVGGETLTVIVPGPRGNSQFCYPVYDYSAYDYTTWEQIGIYCQKNEAQQGDTILFYNGILWNATYGYEFFDTISGACAPDLGPGYYYFNC